MTAGTSTGAATRRTITAFFDSRGDAERAIEKLSACGIGRDNIRLVPGNERDTGASGSTTSTGDMGFWDSLKDMFLPDEDRYAYAEGLRRGGYLVSVTATDAQYDRVLDILDDEGTIDMDERESSWRSQGWSGYASRGATNEIGSTAIGAAASTATGLSSTTGVTGTGAAGTGYTGTGSTGAGFTGTDVSGTAATGTDLSRTGSLETGRETVIPVAEEQLRVGKRETNHGRVRVRSYVVETPVTEQVSLREEHVNLDRRPVDRPVTAADELFRERTIEVDERAEEAVVAKEARVREELVVNKDVRERTETVSDTVRHTEVEIEDDRVDRATGTTGTSTNRRT